MSLRSFSFAGAGATLLLISTSCLADEVVDDAEHWYRKIYAPLWVDEPWENTHEVQRHYAPTIKLLSVEGEETEIKSGEWIEGAMIGWKAEGWVGSDLASLQPSKISDTEVSFQAQWRDRYQDGVQESSCGWYQARLRQGTWQFEAYRDAECASEDGD